jgi:hypothetical protein
VASSCALRSWAIVDAPMIVPSGSRIAETVTATGSTIRPCGHGSTRGVVQPTVRHRVRQCVPPTSDGRSATRSYLARGRPFVVPLTCTRQTHGRMTPRPHAAWPLAVWCVDSPDQRELPMWTFSGATALPSRPVSTSRRCHTPGATRAGCAAPRPAPASLGRRRTKTAPRIFGEGG